MLRTVTRLSHSRADIIASNSPRDQNPLKPSNDWRKWVLLPVNARKKNIELIKKQERLTKLSENSKYNDLKINPDARLGIIVSGITYNYLMENINDLNEPVNILKICQYPIPFKLVNELVKNSEDILVIEEGYPFIESKMQGMFGVPGTIVRGRMSGDLPRTGEMNSDFVREALGLETQSHQGIDQSTIPNRPPMLCKGCPHADTFKALAEAVNDIPSAKIYSDIGCYTLGVLPPYNCGESCVDMGASLSMAFGSSGMGVHPAIAIIGDSTFIHSGMTPLIGAAKENADVNVFIMDNALVAMTGAQETMASGQKLIDIVAELGVDRNHIVTFNPLPKNHDENVKLIQKELEYEGTSVIIPQRPCIHSKKR